MLEKNDELYMSLAKLYFSLLKTKKQLSVYKLKYIVALCIFLLLVENHFQLYNIGYIFETTELLQ